MRILTLSAIATLMLASTAPAFAAASGRPIPLASLTSHCRDRAAADFRTSRSRVNVMGASQAPGNNWVVVGRLEGGIQNTKDFMCTYDLQRRFIAFTRLDYASPSSAAVGRR
jgi:hypothetical protein